MLQITFGLIRSPTSDAKSTWYISGLYLLPVAKVFAEEIPWAELWKQADCNKTYKLDKDYQDDSSVGMAIYKTSERNDQD